MLVDVALIEILRAAMAISRRWTSCFRRNNQSKLNFNYKNPPKVVRISRQCRPSCQKIVTTDGTVGIFRKKKDGDESDGEILFGLIGLILREYWCYTESRKSRV